MLHATTIVWCLLGFASPLGTDSDRNMRVTEVRADVQLPTMKDSRKLTITLAKNEKYHVHEHEAAVQSFDDPDHSVSKSSLLAQLKADERFWRTYRDFDADADSILAWQDFQTELAERN